MTTYEQKMARDKIVILVCLAIGLACVAVVVVRSFGGSA